MSIDNNTPVDPRVQVELEKLNTSTDNINKYEVELDEAKCEFRQLLAESIQKITFAANKLTNSIQTAKPYYEARLHATQLSKQCQQAAINHDKAKSIHAAAKEMVYLAEQGLGEKSTLDTACQEMLSHAASRVNQSQIDCIDTKNAWKMYELQLDLANSRVFKLQSQLKSAIKASRPYYETRANFNGLLKQQKERINELESKVSESKLIYNDSLKNLEQISEEIHKMREERRQSSITICNASNIDLIPNLYTNLPIPAVRETKTTNYSDDTELNISEEWTEIHLSHSDSTSSGYSQTKPTTAGSNTSLNDDGKITCCSQPIPITNLYEDQDGLTSWLTKSNSRRQSFDLLIDVKDVFTNSIQKMSKSLERRSSDSEVNNGTETNDFFLFRSDKDGLSDEQVENLLLNNESDQFLEKWCYR